MQRLNGPKMSEPQQSLRELFNAALAARAELESLQSASEQYRESLLAALSTFERCRALAANVSLFSPNETEDDVSSGDLQYLGIDYYIGDLSFRASRGDRTEVLRGSQAAFGRYLDLLDMYDLLAAADKKLYERYLEAKDTFSVLASSDAAARRGAKIARYKQEKELKQKLEVRNSLPPPSSPRLALHVRDRRTYRYRSTSG